MDVFSLAPGDKVGILTTSGLTLPGRYLRATERKEVGEHLVLMDGGGAGTLGAHAVGVLSTSLVASRAVGYA